jgi:hypothetical protein
MPTKKTLRDDIFLQLTQAAPSDDLELPSSQVDYWVDVTLNALVANEINEKQKRGQFIPNVYIKKENLSAGEFEDSNENDRVYFELTDDVLVINNGGGIIRVITDEGDIVNRASVQTLNLFNAMRFAKPSEQNLLYTQEGSRLYVEGLKQSDIDFDSIEVWYVPKQDILNEDDNYEVLVSDLTLPMLIAEVVAIGMRELYGTQIDKENDGMPGTNPVYHQQIKNPQA